MADKSKDERTEASAVELDEKELESVTGGVRKGKAHSQIDDEKDDYFKKARTSIGGFEGDKSKL